MSDVLYGIKWKVKKIELIDLFIDDVLKDWDMLKWGADFVYNSSDKINTNFRAKTIVIYISITEI